MNRIRLLFLIRSLEIGGAERQLICLVKGLDKRRFEVTVATFYDGGSLRAECIAAEGVRVVCLGKKTRWDLIRPGRRFWRLVRDVSPHIIHGYLGVANELSLLGGHLAGARVVWGMRCSNITMTRCDRLNAGLFRVAAGLSRGVDLQIYNSYAGKQWHVAHGYRGRMVVVPNGICTRRFNKDKLSGLRLRQQWGVRKEHMLIGIVARLDPFKDHSTFLRCAAELAACHPQVRFVCVGGGNAAYQRELRELARELRIDERLTWAGATAEPEVAYNALDLLISSSFTEGTPNAVAEAMACEIPCVVTDAGDSARIAQGVGAVVPPANPTALAAAAAKVLALSAEQRGELGRAARQRIVDLFSLERMVRETEEALVNLRG